MNQLKKRPQLGLKIIAAILLVNSAILISFSVACFALPEQEAKRVLGFFSSLPYFRNLPLEFDPWTAFVDLFLGLWGVLKGIGIWRMWRWVRMLVIIDLVFRMGDLVMFGALSDRATLIRFLSNPDFLINFAINLLVLLYLVDPGVKEAYERDQESI
jgi:hypothetical protein